MSKTHSRHRSGARPDHPRTSNTKAEAKEAKSPSEKRILEAKKDFAPPGGSFIGRRVGRTSKDLGDVLRPIAPEERRAGVPSTARRNVLKNTAKVTHELEDSATGKPSRKSTRKAGVTHVKSDANLRLRAVRAATAPKTVATTAASKKRSPSRRAPA